MPIVYLPVWQSFNGTRVGSVNLSLLLLSRLCRTAFAFIYIVQFDTPLNLVVLMHLQKYCPIWMINISFFLHGNTGLDLNQDIQCYTRPPSPLWCWDMVILKAWHHLWEKKHSLHITEGICSIRSVQYLRKNVILILEFRRKKKQSEHLILQDFVGLTKKTGEPVAKIWCCSYKILCF